MDSSFLLLLLFFFSAADPINWPRCCSADIPICINHPQLGG
jgi:hypothetical protein